MTQGGSQTGGATSQLKHRGDRGICTAKEYRTNVW